MPSPNAAIAFDDSAEAALTRTPGSPDLTLHRRTSRGWAPTPSVMSGLGDVATAALVDDATRILTVSSEGDFELFDAESGRRVAFDLVLDAPLEPVTVVNVRKAGDDLYVGLLVGRIDEATIKIPIGVDALASQLCALHDAPSCGTRS